MNFLFLGTHEDKAYLPYLKPFFKGNATYLVTEPVTTLVQLEMYCAKRSVGAIVSTNTTILGKLLEKLGNPKDTPKLSEYAGSLFKYKNLEIVFVNPLAQLFSVSYGRFIISRYISKVVAPEAWLEPPKFSWDIFTAANANEKFSELESAYAIAVDIETFRHNLAIRCVGYTGVFISDTGTVTTKSIVIPLDSDWALAWVRKINNLPIQKITQNGKYDNAYLLRYNAPLHSWYWDTAHFMHSWYSELPKDLAFLNAFFLRSVVYWKDLAETNDLHEYYKYNALDTWATANVWIAQMLSAPGFARKNYILEFPLVYPCLFSELTGVQRDTNKLVDARKEVDGKINSSNESLRRCIDVPNFNANSHVQVKLLLKTLGCADIAAESSDEKHLNKAAYRHPLNRFILDKILDIRGYRKLATTYLRMDSDADKKGEGGSKEYCGTILYSINPHGTDTGRNSSNESCFWCGFNIQNIPRGIEVKQTIRSPEHFYLAECDLEQAESRDTAHIAGDNDLIKAVSGTRDFHSVNASAFFGVAYPDIYDDATGKTKDKKLRDLAKRVNHGANYNMGAATLVDTMGLEKIWEAKKLLKLSFIDPKKIAEHLLEQFHKTYKALKSAYYVHVVSEIGTTKMLTSRAYHHTPYNLKHHTDVKKYIEEGDWTRYCFGNPDKNKLDLNAYVAHGPQSLNARTLNEAYLQVFYEVALPNSKDFRLHAQIHDSIFFSYRKGKEHLAERVRELMEIPVTVCDVSGVTRTFTVPAALKLGIKDKVTGELKRATYWSETE